MHDPDIIRQIGELTEQERRLEEAHRGEGLSPEDHEELVRLEVTLDQLWDLLRQRRALRDAGQDPEQAHQRPAAVVEHYQQ
jgi:hypothetical protein